MANENRNLGYHPTMPRACLVVMACLASACAIAHTSLEQYLRESVAVSVAADNIDITIQFAFPADPSHAERQGMDRDKNGAISKEEREAYLVEIQERADRLLHLTINGQPLPLIPLEDPRLDLQDAPGVARHPHALRLTYFARTPKSPAAGDTLRLDSGLWAELPRMISVAVEAEQGMPIHAKNTQGLIPAAKENTPTCMTEIKWETKK